MPRAKFPSWDCRGLNTKITCALTRPVVENAMVTILSDQIALFAISLIDVAKSVRDLIGYCMGFEL